MVYGYCWYRTPYVSEYNYDSALAKKTSQGLLLSVYGICLRVETYNRYYLIIM